MSEKVKRKIQEVNSLFENADFTPNQLKKDLAELDFAGDFQSFDRSRANPERDGLTQDEMQWVLPRMASKPSS